MAEYPKYYAKGLARRVARNVRDEVKFKFEGFQETDAPIVPTGDNEYQAPPRVAGPEAVEPADEVQSVKTASTKPVK